jgi:hypothetical protein
VLPACLLVRAAGWRPSALMVLPLLVPVCSVTGFWCSRALIQSAR